jgi:glycosyltransferase involved in cell wall biosynthesis
MGNDEPAGTLRSPVGHVLVSAYSCSPAHGSEAAIGWQWVRHLNQHCHVSVITRASNRSSIERWLADNTMPHVHFHYVDALPGFRSWRLGKLDYARWQAQVLRVARQILHEDPYDLAHHVTAASINYPTFLHRLPVPLVYGPVGGGEMAPLGFQEGSGWRAMAYEAARTARQQTLRWDPSLRATLSGSARILAANSQTAALIPEQYHHKVSVLPMVGVERSLITLPQPRTASGCRIYTAGRLLHWKGFHLAVAAFALVSARCPDATLTIVGEGPQRSRLEHQITKAKLDERIQITGWLPRNEAMRIAQHSDILLFPSLRDSGGMVVLEAMAAGTPVICLDTAGPGAIVEPESGIKVPVTTAERVVTDLARAMEHLITDRDARVRISRAAQRRVRNELVWDKKAERLLTLYRDVLSKSSRR